MRAQNYGRAGKSMETVALRL